MMGASVLEPKHILSINNSFEYKHKAKRMGESKGEFVKASYNTGEFSYKDLNKAYGNSCSKNSKSELNVYHETCWFCPAMRNEVGPGQVVPFNEYSESTYRSAASLPPLFAEEWEKLGHAAVFAHITKGDVSIRHFVNDDEDNGSASYFKEKIKDFFGDAEKEYVEDDLSFRPLFWLQGENDFDMTVNEYKDYLTKLWKDVKELGVTHFLIIRTGYWENRRTEVVMKAEEEFAKENKNCYIITRLSSYIPLCFVDKSDSYIDNPEIDLSFCRDSFYGYQNEHYNEKAFIILASICALNTDRIAKGQEPILEKELVKELI